MSLKKVFLFIGILLSAGMLSGCGDDKTNPVEFDGITIQLEQNFKEFNSNNIETKIESGTILKSYKWKNDNGFVENIVITKSNNNNNLDIMSFSTANIDKIKKQIIGYKSLETKSFEISCNGKSSKVIKNYFGITDSIFEKDGKIKYYVQQLYLQTNNLNYIISFTSNEESRIKEIGNGIEKIKCN